MRRPPMIDAMRATVNGKGNMMSLGRWILALLGALSIGVLFAAPAVATGGPDGLASREDSDPPCLCDDGADDPAQETDDDDAPRRAVSGRVSRPIAQRLVTARRGLRDAEAAADHGSDRRAAAHLSRVTQHLAKAHDAAIERADDELPGGAAAVRAVTAVQDRVVLRAADIALGTDGVLHARALSAVETAAEDRDEAARFLFATSGAEHAVRAVGGELERELEILQEIVGDDDTDEEFAEDLGGVIETLVATAEALGLSPGVIDGDDDGEDDAEDDVPVEEWSPAAPGIL